jgi:hypothetical protein
METKKIVVNKCYGGFGLSHEATMLVGKLKGITLTAWKNPRNAAGIADFEKYVEGVDDFMTVYTTDGKEPYTKDNDNAFYDRDICPR